MDATDSDKRERMLALLRANHTFPGIFHLSVITVSKVEVQVALRAAVEAGAASALAEDAWETRSSGGGKYTSHRIQVPCVSAEAVLELYERVWRVEGVVTML